MNRWLNRANSRLSLSAAATLLVGATLFGQILGFMRYQIINANFPANGPSSTDAYFAAFKIPDLFFYTIAAGAFGVALMPFLADKLERGDRRGMWQLVSSLLNLIGIIMLVIGLGILLFAEQLIRWIISSEMSPQQLHNAATIMRLVALNPLLFSVSGILTSVQQTYGRFFFFAVAPIVYNLSIIMSVFLFRDNIGITGLGIGALVGAVLQLFVACFGLFGLGFKYFPTIRFKSADFRSLMRQLPIRSLDQGIDAINSIVETNRARKLGEGVITFYENAYALHNVPIILVGSSIATAVFPRLNRRLSQGRSDLFRRDFIQVLKVTIWIIMPVVIIGYFARGYLARIIYKNDAPEIALIFGFLAGAILFRTIYLLMSRYFYARKNNVTPLLVSLFAIALNVVLVFNLARPSAYGMTGLAMAQSIVAAVEVAILVTIILWKDRQVFNMAFVAWLTKVFSVSGFALLTTFIMITIVPLSGTERGFISLGSKLFFIAAPTLLVYGAFSSLFGVGEIRPVLERLRRIMLKPVKLELPTQR